MSIQIVSDVRSHFRELIESAGQELGINIRPPLRDYLIQLLDYYTETMNLFPGKQVTLAEIWLQAQATSDTYEKIE
ncbi:MAG: hypothetical protein NZ480_09245, partial [Bdellovibrionaceae bacterium]|nr:hypothetical protein [Pseudobdellovibrionaceae bacterium]MDW8190993.1 hypothetical protein [Pseudobdellovibrionaceae bacterium]